MKIFGRKFDKNSIFFWLIPYIVCILISVTLSSISYFQAVKIISGQTKAAHEESAVAISKNIEPQLASAGFSMMQIIASEYIETICEEPTLPTADSSFVLGQLQTKLSDAGNLNDIVSEEYIFFHRSNYLLSGDNFYSGQGTEEHLREEYGLSKTDTKSLLNSKESMRYRLVPSPGGTQAFLVHAVPFSGSYEDGATIILHLNSSGFLDSLNIHSQTSGRFSAIIDKDNTMLLSGTRPSQRIIHQGSRGSAASTEYGKGSGRIVASAIMSGESDWEYVTGIPYSVLMAPINRILLYIFAFALLGIMAGVIVAYYFARKNYSSLDHLMKQFMESLSISRKEGTSFSGLEMMLEDLIRERKDLYTSFEKYRDVAKDHVLLRILGGGPASLTGLYSSLKELNIDLSGKHYTLLVISVDDYSHAFFDDDSVEDENIPQLINLIISNVVSDLANKEFPTYITEFMGFSVCIMNTKENPPNAEEKIKSMAKSAIDFIRLNFGISLSAIVSKECSDLDDVNTTLMETINFFELFDHRNAVYITSENSDSEDQTDTLQQPKADLWIQEICTYIDHNYTDKALNISYLGYRFEMNPAYVGRRFKEVMGYGILEYIHTKRIGAAKDLIESGISLKDAADRVGFSNTLTMRRVFERYKIPLN